MANILRVPGIRELPAVPASFEAALALPHINLQSRHLNHLKFSLRRIRQESRYTQHEERRPQDSPMNSKRLHSARKADEGRPKGVNLFLFCLSIAIAAGCGAFYYSEYVTGFSFLYLSAPIASLYLSQIYLRESSHRICHLWRCSKRGAVLTTTRTLANWELGTLLLVSLSCPLGIVAWVLRQRGEWIGPTALLAIGSIGIRYLTPIIRARGLTRQRISLTKNGVELTQIDGHTDTIPWKAHPHLMGIHQGDAVITLKNRQEIRYPVSYLPMGTCQLERLLSTFSSDDRLRAPSSRNPAPSAPSSPFWNPPRKNGQTAPGPGIPVELPQGTYNRSSVVPLHEDFST